jgi:predicted HTH domain antitoxin
LKYHKDEFICLLGDEVLSLFREEKITASRGAELLSIPIQDFMDLLNQNGLSLDDVTTEEIEEDLKLLQKLRTKYEKKAQAV